MIWGIVTAGAALLLILVALLHAQRRRNRLEKEMVERFGGELECDVLKCGHHGSSTSTTDLFLEKTNPTWAVISCGKDNSYGHPHAEVIAKLEADDIQIYRTDLLGTITARSDGKQISWSHE